MQLSELSTHVRSEFGCMDEPPEARVAAHILGAAAGDVSVISIPVT